MTFDLGTARPTVVPSPRWQEQAHHVNGDAQPPLATSLSAHEAAGAARRRLQQMLRRRQKRSNRDSSLLQVMPSSEVRQKSVLQSSLHRHCK
jgi:hypothetical protein